MAATGLARADAATPDDAWGPVTIAGHTVAPGASDRFTFAENLTFRSWYLGTPIFVARGSAPGPALCLTAGIHGDELNGVEVARRAYATTDVTRLSGTLIAVPAINAQGVRTGDRYLTDRRDLNRAFPGKEGGSIASLIAFAITSQLLPHCDFVIDLHTGSDQRANVPQIRADLEDEAVRGLAMHFAQGIVVGGAGPDGSWRREAVRAGVPAIIYEAGEPHRFQQDEIEHGVAGVRNVMAWLGMIEAPVRTVPEDKVYTRSRWLRAGLGQSGFFFPEVALGDQLKAGDLLGRIVDPFDGVEHEIRATSDGTLIGMAVSRPVLDGYGLFHLAWVK